MGIREDYIDFQRSDTFRGFFYEKGLTPHPPPDLEKDRIIKELTEELASLKYLLVDILENSSTTPVQASTSDYGRSEYPRQQALPKPIRRIVT